MNIVCWTSRPCLSQDLYKITLALLVGHCSWSGAAPNKNRQSDSYSYILNKQYIMLIFNWVPYNPEYKHVVH